MSHVPVLLHSVMGFLNPQPNQNFVDATLGGGGHSKEILVHTSPRGMVLGVDWDADALERLRSQSIPRLIMQKGNFAHIENIVAENEFGPISGILFDLGFSSLTLEESGRGFSFQKDEPLDMRYDQDNPRTAAHIVNRYAEEEIANILWQYGEERYNRRIAAAIRATRKQHSIQTTTQLLDVIARAVPAGYRHSRMHYATKTFQALRIATNDELENIRQGLTGALKILPPKSRLVVLSFHSLEDRIVKNFLRDNKDTLTILTKKPIGPDRAEVDANPRARSAKLRAAEVID